MYHKLFDLLYSFDADTIEQAVHLGETLGYWEQYKDKNITGSGMHIWHLQMDSEVWEDLLSSRNGRKSISFPAQTRAHVWGLGLKRDDEINESKSMKITRKQLKRLIRESIDQTVLDNAKARFEARLDNAKARGELEGSSISDSIKNKINIYLIFDGEKFKNKRPDQLTDEDLKSPISDSNIFYLDEFPDFIINWTPSQGEINYGSLAFMRQSYPNVESLKNRQLDNKIQNIYFEKIGEKMTSRSSVGLGDETSDNVKKALEKRSALHKVVAAQAFSLKLAILKTINSLIGIANSAEFVYSVIDYVDSERNFRDNYRPGSSWKGYSHLDVYRLKQYGEPLIAGGFSNIDKSVEIDDLNFSLKQKLYILAHPVNIAFNNKEDLIENLFNTFWEVQKVPKDIVDEALIIFKTSLEDYSYEGFDAPSKESTKSKIGEIVDGDATYGRYPNGSKILKGDPDVESLFRKMNRGLSKLDTLINRGGLKIPTLSNLDNVSIENSYDQIGVDE